MNNIQKSLSAAFALANVTACAHDLGDSQLRGSEVNTQIYVFESGTEGFNTKTVFYDNGSEVVAFGAQFTPVLAGQALSFLRTRSTSPIRYLVVTHPNPDKFNGIDAFKREGAEVVASEETARALPGVHTYKKNFFVNIAGMFTEESYPSLGNIDKTFQEELKLELSGGDTIELSKLSGPGVSSTQTVAYLPAVNGLVVGDLVHHQAHAWLEGGIENGSPKPEMLSWIKVLEEIEQGFGALNPMVFGGRGEVAPLKVSVSQQIKYLKAVNRIVEDYVAGLGERRVELTRERASEHWTVLRELIEGEFPEYYLGYMIEYGV